MSRISKKTFIFFLTLLVMIGVFGTLKASALEVDWPKAPGGKELYDESTLIDFIEYAYYWGILLGGLAAFFGLINGGFRYLTSVGNPAKMKEAREKIIAAIGGLILLLSSFLILNTINPELTVLVSPSESLRNLSWLAQNPEDMSRPCEAAIFYLEKNYKGNSLVIASSSPNGLFLETCYATGQRWWIFQGNSAPIKSIKIIGACQVNLYEWPDCGGSFTAIGKSMPNLDWLSQEGIYGIKVADISPPQRATSTILGVTDERAMDPSDPNSLRQITFGGVVTDMGRSDIAYGFFEYGDNDVFLQGRAPVKSRDDTELFAIGDIFSHTAYNLATDTTYYWRAVTRNAAGLYFSATSTFTTGF